MTYAIRIEGLERVQKLLGQDFGPAIQNAAYGIAAEIEDEVAPYPPATVANSPSNPSGRWYERGYGPRWIRKGRAARSRTGTIQSLRRLGAIGGRKTSKIMSKQWAKERMAKGAVLSNIVPYSPFLHSQARQVGWAGDRGWVTDKEAIERVIRSGKAVKIILQAVMAKLWRH